MKISARPILMAAVATVTASAVVFAQSIQPAPPPTPPTPAPTVQLAAIVQPTALPPLPSLLTVLLNSPLALLGPPTPLGTGLPPTPTPQAIPIAPNLANTIDSIYISVEPWVQYGFEVATAVVRWIPYVGWFAGLIMDGYFFGESLVASGVFNITDWLRGNGGFAENLVDFGVDVGLAFIWLGLDALNSFIPLPPIPLPPRPPVQGPFLASTMLVDPTETPELTMLSSEVEGLDQVEGLRKAVTAEEAVTQEEVVTEQEAVTEQDVVTEQEAVTEEKDVTEEDVTEEDTHTKVTRTDKSTTDSSGNIEAQGEIRGPNVDKSIHQDADGSVAQGADGTEGAGGAGRVDGHAPEETVKNTDDSAAPTDATKADADTGDNDNK